MMFFGFGFLLVLGLLVWLAVGRSNVLGQTVSAMHPTPGAGNSNRQPATDDAESIVRERYARGELDHAEYEQLIRGLRS